jgi:hypothetical protein
MRTESRLEAAPQIVHQPLVCRELSEDDSGNGLDVRVRSQVPVVGHLQATLRLLSGEKADFQPFPEALLRRVADDPLRHLEVRSEEFPEAFKGILEVILGDVVDGVDLLILPNAEWGIRNAESLNASMLASEQAGTLYCPKPYEGTRVRRDASKCGMTHR